MSRTLPIGNEGPRAVDFALGPIYLRRNPQVALCGASSTSSSGVRERPGYVGVAPARTPLSCGPRSSAGQTMRRTPTPLRSARSRRPRRRSSRRWWSTRAMSQARLVGGLHVGPSELCCGRRFRYGRNRLEESDLHQKMPIVELLQLSIEVLMFISILFCEYWPR